MSKLYYEIAEQLICIDTQHQEKQIEAILQKYQPFKIHTTETKPLLDINWDTRITLDQGAELLEHVNEYGLTSLVYREELGFYIILDNGKCRVEGRVSEDWQRLTLSVDWENEALAPYIDRMIMITYSMALIPLSYLKVHASVTELEGRALVFMGVSGTGKSTHSRLWREYVPGCTLLNDDEPFVRLMPSGEVRVYGCPWSGSTPCYRKESATLTAFVHLYQAQENKLTRLSGSQALISLYSSSVFLLRLTKYKDKVFDTIVEILNKVPLYRLDNRPEEEAVRLTRALLP